VRPHGVWADVELVGHRLATQSLDEQAQHLALSAGQLTHQKIGAVLLRRSRPGDPGGGPPGEHDLSLERRLDHLDELRHRSVLRHVSVEPGTQHVPDRVIVVECREHHDLGCGRDFEDLGAHRHATPVW
jgi:hypothetical protein